MNEMIEVMGGFEQEKMEGRKGQVTKEEGLKRMLLPNGPN